MKNAQLLAAVLASVLAAPVFAGAPTTEANLFPEADLPSTVTREQVRAEIGRARENGTLGGVREDRLFAAEESRASKATVTREQVRRELAEARAHGELVTSDDPLKYLTPHGPQRSREEVRAEAREAARHVFLRRGS